MNASLTVTHTKTFNGAPLAVVDGLPGGSADLTPDQMRAIAAALMRAADDCESAASGACLRRQAQVYALALEGGAA
jgi:hypothetical protein